MAEVRRVLEAPNILLVGGEDVYGDGGDVRPRLRDYLHGAAHPSVQRGSHDFWITYKMPDNGSEGPNHDHMDMGISPRPLRGIVYMNVPGDTSDAALVDHTSTLFQEVGHHWLVPDDLRFRSPDGEHGMLVDREIIQCINDDTAWTDYALIGRGRHWSTFMEGDGSALDGMHWTERGTAAGAMRWDQTFPPERGVIEDSRSDMNVLNNVPEAVKLTDRRINLSTTYNDLDLVLMDALAAPQAYPNHDNQVRWLEPFMVSNIDFHAGIAIVLGQQDFIYFGFYRDYRKLAVQRTGQPLTIVADLGDDRNLFEATRLRAIRRDGRMFLEAAHSDLPDMLSAGSDERPFTSGPLTLPTDHFRTLAVVDLPVAPVAAGLITKTWTPALVELDCDDLQLADGNGSRRLSTDHEPPEFARDQPYDQALTSGELRRFDVAGPFLSERKSFVRSREGVLTLGCRFAVNPVIGQHVDLDAADHWLGVDQAPKVLVKVSPGDFTFGARVRVRRVGIAPWSAGGANNCSMWGHRKSARCTDAIIPDHLNATWRGDRHLRMAFIVVTPNFSDIDMAALARIDLARRLWQSAFGVTTRQRWQCISVLEPVPQR